MKTQLLLASILFSAVITTQAAESGAFQLYSVAEKAGATTKEYSYQLRSGREEVVYLNPTALLDGSAVKSATVQNGQDGTPEVLVTFTPEGSTKFGEITAKNVGKRIAIMVDGKVYSAPTVNEPIRGGSAVITGKFTQEEAADLAKRLNGKAGE